MWLDERIVKIAKKYDKTPAQVILRWNTQAGIAVLAKTTNENRLKENMKIFDFDLSIEDIEALSALNQNLRIGSDPYTLDF